MERYRENITLEYLRSNDTVLSRILDSLFDGVYIVDRDRGIVFWNQGAELITGYSLEEVTGRCCANNILNHVDETGMLLCMTACPLARSMDTGQNVEAKVYPLCKGGSRIPVETHISPIRDGSGVVIGAIEIFRDISQQEAFRVLQEKFNDLIRKYVSNTTFDGVMQQVQAGATSQAVRRDLTVLFVDVVGFTCLSETAKPGEVLDLLNDLFTVCQQVTEAHLGDIDKFMGDAALAVFIDANDAVEAARHILAAIREVNNRRVAACRAPIQVRIGINSGPLVQGDVGGSERKDLTVIGDVVNTAARIEKACRPDSMCISEATWSRLKTPEAFCLVDRIELRGKRAPLAIFEPTGGDGTAGSGETAAT